MHSYCSRSVFATLTVIIYLFWVVIGDLRLPFFSSTLLLSSMYISISVASLRVFPVRNSSKRRQLYGSQLAGSVLAACGW
jgi:hypothetical protein